MRKIFNNRGEGYINTGVKIIIAVVIGALILGGLYLLFAGDYGVFGQMNDNIEGLMEYEGDDVVVRIDNDTTYVTDLQYSSDGIRWYSATTPTYAEGAVIEMIASHDTTHCATVRDKSGVYIMTSIDNGATWEKVRSWSTRYELSIRWDEEDNCFWGYHKTTTSLQNITSVDGIVWKDYGFSWDLDW